MKQIKIFLTLCIALLNISGCRLDTFIEQDNPEHSSVSIEIPINELNERIVCSEDVAKAIEIMDKDQAYLVPFAEFVETPIIHNKAICQTVLTRWFTRLLSTGRKTVTLKLTPQPSADQRPTYVMLSPELLDFCLSEGICARNILDYQSVDKALISCQPRQNLNTIWQRMRPRLLKTKYYTIPKMRVLTFPITTFTNQIEKISTDSPEGQLDYTLSSTMTIGTQTARKMSNRHSLSSTPLFLALDAGVSFGSGQMLLLAEIFNSHPSIFPLPITSGIEHQTLHHWKLAVNNTADKSILTSLNLATPEKVTHTDFIYQFDNPEITAELRWLLWQRLEQSCQRFDDYQCFVDFAYKDALARSNLYRLFQDSCSRLTAVPNEIRPNPVPAKYFLQPQDSDLEWIINDMIASAKHEIIILSHKLTVPSIVNELRHAQQRGIQVTAITTEAPPRYIRNDAPFIKSFKDTTAAGVIPEPHMKVMIIDRTKLLFGTGNFSINALHSARELFAVTNDKDAIATVLRVVVSLSKVLEQLSQRESKSPTTSWGLGRSDTSWIVLKARACEAPPCRLPPISPPYTIRHGDPALRNYRQVHPKIAARLSECSLNEELFIPEDSYLNCLVKLNIIPPKQDAS